MKLGNQTVDLDKLADEVLSKSVDTTKEDTAAADKTVNPEDVSANIPENDGEKPEEVTPEEKEEKEETPAEEPVKKSEEVETEPTKEDEESEDVEKSCSCNKDSIKKAEDAGDEESGEDEEDEEIEKSLKNEFNSDENIRKSIEASDFLESVVECIVKSLANTQRAVQDSTQHSENVYEVFAKSLSANLKQTEAAQKEIQGYVEDMKKSIKEEIDTVKSEIMDALDDVLHQPASMRKSMKSVSVHDKNFQKSLGAPAEGENLNKSQVLGILNSEFYSGNPLVTPQDIINYESGAPLKAELANLVRSKC